MEILRILYPTLENVKKVRAPKKKKEEPPIVVSDDEEPDDVKVIEATIVVDEPIVEEDKKKDENIKVVELLQCEKCGKKLTARTLKYNHNNVCPVNENKTPPKPKRVKQNDSKDDIVVAVTDQSQPPTRIEKKRNYKTSSYS